MLQEPTVSEVVRDLQSLEQRVDRERRELLDEVRAGFAMLQTAIEAQSAERITKEVYSADQRRFEAELLSLRNEVSSMRRVFVGGFLTVIAASVALQMVMGG